MNDIREKDAINLSSIGGSWQFTINTVNDFRNLLKLDPAHWAMTAIQSDIIRCDADFLNLMKSEETGRIRIEAVRALLTWMLETLCDLQGALDETDVLALSSLNQQSNDGAVISATMSEILSVLKLAPEATINIAQLNEYKSTVAASNLNGDCVIPPECVSDPALADFIRLVMTVSGSQKDASGKDGISSAELDAYLKIAADYLAWREKGIAEHNTIYAFGDATPLLWNLYNTVKLDVDRFFDSCHAIAYTANHPAGEIHNTFDPHDQSTFGDFFNKAPIAPANTQFILSVAEENNPAKVSSVVKFLTEYRKAVSGDSTRISLAEWELFKGQIATYGAWISSKNTDKLDGMTSEKINESLKIEFADKIRELIKADGVIATNLANCALLYKLLLCQKNMRVFLNNFAGMQALFSANEPSLLLAGHLVMDGRNFELSMPVTDIAAHKSIAQNSNICILYLEVTSGTGAALKKMTIATAVTSGNMRSLYVGKTGLFFTVEGKIWDAKIIDILSQPVSIPEVFLLPFTKLAELIRKQTDKYLASKSKDFENQATAATESPQAVKNTSANASMLLMGGGIGIAALGSSFAFIAKTLKDVSLTTIVCVLIGIIFIFGAPFIIPGLIKLFTRSLTLFLEADGCSMNRKMRMSISLGNYFTYIPKLPEGSKHTIAFEPPPRRNSSTPTDAGVNKRMFLFIILFILIAVAFFGFHFFHTPKAAPAPVQQESIEQPAESQEANTPADDQQQAASQEAKDVSAE